MGNIEQAERSATRDEVIARRGLRRILRLHGPSEPRVRSGVAVIVRTDDLGCGPLNRATGPSRRLVGRHVQLITDDTPGAAEASDTVVL